MLNLLREHDPRLLELPTSSGGVLVAPGLQGRILCHIQGELIHQLDRSVLENPSQEEFNNLGGNSLWPAPEGGEFAFNYPPGSGEWYVQPGINNVEAQVVSAGADDALVEKKITLVNKKGTELSLAFSRHVTLMGQAPWKDYDCEGIGYRCTDTLTPTQPLTVADALLAPWSLEQFPGGEGIVAFAKAEGGEEAVNFEFYGDPRDRMSYGDGWVAFKLGGEDRQQIGFRVANRPELIGALDPGRGLLILRTTAVQNGTYFNIADNDQPEGAYSAADLYSVFNGGDLNFFELETIGALQSADGMLAASSLTSETVILRGEVSELRRYLKDQKGLGEINL